MLLLQIIGFFLLFLQFLDWITSRKACNYNTKENGIILKNVEKDPYYLLFIKCLIPLPIIILPLPSFFIFIFIGINILYIIVIIKNIRCYK